MRRVTTRGNVHQRERPRPSVVARSRASRDRGSANPTPRAIPRRRRAIPRKRRSSPRRRAVGFARVGFARVARGRGIQASRASRARFARRARDSRFATDRRVVSRAAGSRASTRASRSRSRVAVRGVARVDASSRSRRPTATDRPRVLTVYAYETVCPHCLPIRHGPLRGRRPPLEARAATAVDDDDDDDDDDARAARAGVRDRRRDGGVESARARDARTHRTTRADADARGDSDPHRVLRKVKLHASGEDVHR